MKQTSIEWLKEKLDGYDFNNHHMEVNIVISLPKYVEILNQAKAMHKQEIEDAYTESRCEWNEIKSSTDYYNETYGK